MSGFVTLLVLSTGRRPWRDRITEIAAVRVIDGAFESAYSTTLGYEYGPPRRLVDEWGGLDDHEAVLTFAEVEPHLRAFVADLLLVGPDVRLHLAHLEYELSRLNRPGLANRSLDLSTLAQVAGSPVARGEKPTLARLAESLGLPPARPGDLPAEARLAARATLRLAQGLDRRVYPTLDAVAATADPERPRPLLQPWQWTHLSEGPGVYVLLDEQDQPLYVGKASDLRRRVGSYLGHALATARRMDGLADATARVETVSTETELEAILLEARLIRQHHPPYNVQRSVRQPRLFLRLHLGDRRPRLAQTATIGSDGAVYLGPFRSASAASRARHLADALFGLQTRRGQTDQSYLERLQQALLFLTGERENAVARLQAQMRGCARAGDAPGVARARELLRQALAFSLEDAALSMSPHTDTFVVCDGRQGYLIHAARLVERIDASSLSEARARLAPSVGQLAQTGAVDELDEEAYLVLRWLSARGSAWQIALLNSAVGNGR